MQDIQTEWDLTSLYNSPEDSQIEKDVKKAKSRFQEFREKWYEREDYLKDIQILKEALQDYENLKEGFNSSKPVRYFYLLRSLNSNDQEVESKLNKLSQKLTKIRNTILFFKIKLGQIEEEKQKEFLKAEELEHFHYFLKRIFIEAEYKLEEQKEEILQRTRLPRYSMWTNGVEKSVNKKTVKFNDEEIPISEALNKISEIEEHQKRQNLHEKSMEKLREVGDFSESEINAVITNKKITDELRGYEKPYSETILKYENKEEVVLNLVETVTQSFDVSHDFYEIKSEILKKDPLSYADRSAPIGEIQKEIDFEESVKILKNNFKNLDEKYYRILEKMLQNGQIDVYPREGKKGGAFCSGSSHIPTFVLLNYVPSFNAATTFAHEMGHAIHRERSKEQPVLYEGYTTSVAETASTFFEQVVFEAVFKKLNKEEKFIALHDKINQQIATIFRQIALFNFEKELHETIREEGSVSQKEIAKMHNKHMKKYLGPKFEFKDKDGFYYVSWPHIRYFFYSYSYTYGALISQAMYKKYEEDNSYIKKIDQFLTAGRSKSPYEIFKEIGIDTHEPDIFEEGIANIQKNIDRLKNLHNSS